MTAEQKLVDHPHLEECCSATREEAAAGDQARGHEDGRKAHFRQRHCHRSALPVVPVMGICPAFRQAASASGGTASAGEGGASVELLPGQRMPPLSKNQD